MVTPHQRSRTLRRVYVKTPGGKTVLHHEKRKPGKAQCAHCGKPLSGVPNVRATQMNQYPKTQRRPERPYGGMLCSPCTRAHIIQQVRSQQ
ncbi:50S ribosomal protein L34e [Candidatus Woesearchaeota archaeon]|nr:50S ribosomal protein L34e [Candidatus Woesearchaeota archaeon]